MIQGYHAMIMERSAWGAINHGGIIRDRGWSCMSGQPGILTEVFVFKNVF